jgi:hypothetical protein
MQYSHSDDELWDEHQWDAHISEVEKKSDQLRKFITSRILVVALPPAGLLYSRKVLVKMTLSKPT